MQLIVDDDIAKQNLFARKFFWHLRIIAMAVEGPLYQIKKPMFRVLWCA